MMIEMAKRSKDDTVIQRAARIRRKYLAALTADNDYRAERLLKNYESHVKYQLKGVDPYL